MADNDFWHRLKKRFKEVSNAAADFTEEQALIGKLKFEILTMKRKVDRLQTNLGRTIYDLFHQQSGSKPFDNADVQSFISEIGDLEKLIEVKRKEITDVADHFRSQSTRHQGPEPSQPTSEKPFEPPAEDLVEPTAVTSEEPEQKTRKRRGPKKKSETDQKATTSKRGPKKRKTKKADQEPAASEAQVAAKVETKEAPAKTRTKRKYTRRKITVKPEPEATPEENVSPELPPESSPPSVLDEPQE